jgi:glutathione synthase/RimK-type ligase-like ATP-grasp enzyme
MSDEVVIVAPEHDDHARAVRDHLHGEGTRARILDTSRFPAELSITLGERLEEIEIDGERVRPRSVYVRDLGLNPSSPGSDFDARMRGDWRRAVAALQERADFVLALLHRWERAGIPVYNPLSAFPRITKPYQLALLADAGLPVPSTRWTNDPSEVRAFAAGRRMIYKPVYGGAATRELEDRDLGDDRLALLRAAPVCFQELLPGKDLRVYVLDGSVIAAIEITADAIDFRQHEQAMRLVGVDGDLQEICIRACETLGLRFTGMDLKADVRGELRILELNPSPMFLGFDRMSGSRILNALCRALARGTVAVTRTHQQPDDVRHDQREGARSCSSSR